MQIVVIKTKVEDIIVNVKPTPEIMLSPVVKVN